MNRELLFIKTTLYPGVWKFGIAIYNYRPTSLGYLVYSIRDGENGPLIKQMPDDFALLQQMPYEVMSNFNVENSFEKDYHILLKDRVKYHLEKFVQYYTVLPFQYLLTWRVLQTIWKETYKEILFLWQIEGRSPKWQNGFRITYLVCCSREQKCYMVIFRR